MAVDAVGIVLAAGAGTRYGSPKVLAKSGAWLHKAVHSLLAGGCDDVLVVLGAAHAPMPDGARAVHAPDWASGMSASLKAGLSAAGDAEFAVMHVVDTPDVGSEVVQAVLDGARSAPSRLARAVYSGLPGHPVVFGREHWDEIRASSTGDSGARDFLRARNDVVTVECSLWATGLDHDYR